MGLTFPNAARAGRRLRQERRRHRRARRARLRLRRDRHRHRRAPARQPAAAAVPAAGGPRGRQPDGLQQRRRRGRWPRRLRARVGRRATRRAGSPRDVGRPRREHRQDQGGARGRPGGVLADYEKSARGCSRRTPTTSWSTSARPTPRGCATCRRSSGSSRCSPRYAARPTTRADRRGARCWSRSPPTWPTTTSLAVAELALALGLDGIIATNTTISRDGLRRPRRRGRGDRRRRTVRRAAAPRGRWRCCGCSAAGSADDLTLDRRRRHHHAPTTPARGWTRARPWSRPTPRFVYGGPLWPRRIVARARPMTLHERGAGPSTSPARCWRRRRSAPTATSPWSRPASPSASGPATSWPSRSATTALGRRRAFWIHRVRPDRRLRRDHRDRRRAASAPAPAGWPRCRPARRSRSPARSAGRSPCPRSRPAACWSVRGTPRRRCSPWPSGCASAAARSPWCSAPPTRRTCSPPSRPAGRPARSPWSPSTARSARGAPSPTCSRRARPGEGRRRLRRRPAATLHAVAAAAERPAPGARSRSSGR